MSSTRPVIEAENLGKCYHIYARARDRLKQAILPGGREYFTAFWALREVSLRIARGETLGIIGRNGSGKSTLLQLLSGTVTPTAGTMRSEGKIAAILELGAGFHPEFTGRENVLLNGRLIGLSETEIRARLGDIAAFAELGAYFDLTVKTYSTGMYLRLAFSVIAHVDAEILIIDEALAVGDLFFVQKCVRFLRGFQEKGGTIILVSHDAAAITTLCTRVLWLEGGRIRAVGCPKHVLQDYLAAAHGFGAAGASRSAAPAPSAAREYGGGGVTLVSVKLLDSAGEAVAAIAGGERVIVDIQARANRAVSAAIAGFFVRDRLGQNLFGDNTHRAYRDAPLALGAGETFTARFAFTMPILPAGDYSIAIGLAEGSQESHTLEHWVHEAYGFQSITRNDATGLVGIAMQSVELWAQGGVAAAQVGGGDG